MKVNLMKGDCLELMKTIPDGSVDMILTDPPYGTIKGLDYGDKKRKNKHDWDEILDQEKMLNECNRILRENGCLCLFSQDPYTGKLMTETHNNLPFSYRLTWLKDNFANALMAKKAPVNYTEDINLFFKKYDTLNLNPLREYSKKVFDFTGLNKKQIIKKVGQRADHFFRYNSTQFGLCTEKTYNELIKVFNIDKMDGFLTFEKINEDHQKTLPKVFNLWDGKKYKSNVLEYRKDYQGLHPTQKPVLLLEDLIKTYTNEGMTVLDFTMGSGSTGVACLNTNRNFIGIELNDGYFEIAEKRIREHKDNQ